MNLTSQESISMKQSVPMQRFRSARHARRARPIAVAASVVAALSLGGGAAGQADVPSLFVANNGNLEGSVTSFAIDPVTGQPNFVDRILTSDNDDDPGTNANAISLSPNGKWLAIGHAAGGTSPVRQLTIIEVAPDGTLSIEGEFSTPATPLDVQWIDDEYLVATVSDLSVTNRVIAYRFAPASGGFMASLNEVGSSNTGSFTTSLEKHPTERILYAGDSLGNNVIYVIDADQTGFLTSRGQVATGLFPIDPVVSPAADYLYSFSGISGGGESIQGFRLDANFIPAELPGSPFITPGASPNAGVFSEDGSLLFVSHGTDATVRSFAVDGETGELTSTGATFDVGLQGTVAQMGVFNDVLYVLDDSNAIDRESGVISLKFAPDGSLTQLGGRANTQGVTPTGLAVWPGVAQPCPGDATGDGLVNADDLLVVLGNFGSAVAGGVGDGDFDDSGVVNADDLLVVLGAFGTTCP